MFISAICVDSTLSTMANMISSQRPAEAHIALTLESNPMRTPWFVHGLRVLGHGGAKLPPTTTCATDNSKACAPGLSRNLRGSVLFPLRVADRPNWVHPQHVQRTAAKQVCKTELVHIGTATIHACPVDHTEPPEATFVLSA